MAHAFRGYPDGVNDVFTISDLAVVGVFVTLLVLFALALFHDGVGQAAAPADAVPQSDPLVTSDAGSTAA
jgi:hypothetical protein